MKKTLLALAFSLLASSAWAQCTGIFPNNSYCGNTSGTPAPPTFNPLQSTFVAGPATSTNTGLPIWANTTGTVLQDGAGKTIAGNYTWSGTQTYSATNTFNALANFTNTFQISGTTQTFPASGIHVGTTDTQTLTNKTLTSPTINTPTVSGGTINNAIIGGTTPVAGTFTTDTAVHHAPSNTSQPIANSCAGFAITGPSGDFAGKVSFTSATSCSITFGTAFNNTPFCVVSPGSAASTVQVVASTTGLTATFGTANTVMYYICAGN